MQVWLIKCLLCVAKSLSAAPWWFISNCQIHSIFPNDLCLLKCLYALKKQCPWFIIQVKINFACIKNGHSLPVLFCKCILCMFYCLETACLNIYVLEHGSLSYIIEKLKLDNNKPFVFEVKGTADSHKVILIWILAFLLSNYRKLWNLQAMNSAEIAANVQDCILH